MALMLWGLRLVDVPSPHSLPGALSISGIGCILNRWPPLWHEEFSRQATVLSLGSDPRDDIVELDEDAFPLPVERSKAEEASFDQLPAGRTPGCKRGSSRPGGWRCRLHPPALSADAARQ